MKKKNWVKRIFAGGAVALALTLGISFGGCITESARNGLNGKDLNIYDIYEAAKTQTNNPGLSFDEFLKEYLSYDGSELEEQTSFKAAVNRSLLSSVSVRSYFNYKNTSLNIRRPVSAGSGVIIDIDRESGDMTVVTNCHVVYSANTDYSGDGYSDEIDLWLYGSESNYSSVLAQNAIKARLVAASKSYDLAVLQVTGSEIVKSSMARAAKWSTTEENYVGERVYTVGNANGETLSTTVGYISKDREDVVVNLGSDYAAQNYTYNVMRINAEVNSGNSGGGLYNSNGELAGIVNAKGKSDLSGVGYALPASTVKRVVSRMRAQYLSSGTEVHGVTLSDCGAAVQVTDMYSTGLNDGGLAEIFEEVRVKSVSSNSVARGKLAVDDIIKHVKVTRGNKVIEDMDIKREHNFTDALISAAVGDTVEVVVYRKAGGGSEITVSFDITSGAVKFFA